MAYTEKELEARDEGADAFSEGKPRSANPYSLLSEKNLYTCWDDGWEEAQEESADDDDDDTTDEGDPEVK